jgi:NAD(P)-dependent dehydrogenase (short-subunit alcohol dehydrogenase family)
MPSPEVAISTLKTNVDATIDFTKQFLPLLSPTGRIIIVSSEMSALERQPKKIQEKLSNPDIK